MSESTYRKNLRREMIVFLPDDYESVLEIGCGEGRFANNLKPGCNIWAIEQDSHSAQIASISIENVLNGLYDQVSHDLPNEYFDLVVCNDVIEHMENPIKFLLSIKEKMKPNSFLIGSIPNVRFYKNIFELIIKKYWRYKEKLILDYTHIRFFTERIINRLVIMVLKLKVYSELIAQNVAIQYPQQSDGQLCSI